MKSRVRAMLSTSRVTLVASVIAIVAVATYLFVNPKHLRNGSDLQKLLATFGTDRPFEPRFSGIGAYQKYSAGNRPMADRIAVPSQGLEILAKAQRAVASTQDVSAFRMLAAGELIFGHVNSAIALLTDAMQLVPDSPEIHNDLSVMYLMQAESAEGSRSLALARALEAAATATERFPRLAEGWFNLALTLQNLRLQREAVTAWDRFLTVERDSGWLAEGRQRRSAVQLSSTADGTRAALLELLDTDHASRGTAMADLTTNLQAAQEFVQERLLPAWAKAHFGHTEQQAAILASRAANLSESILASGGDSITADAVRVVTSAIQAGDVSRVNHLAAGHLAYAEGVDLFEANHREEAAQKLAYAIEQLDAGESMFRAMAQAQLGSASYSLRRFRDAERLANQSATFAESLGYLSVLGRSERVRGGTRTESSDLEGALRAFRSAIRDFETAGEHENAIVTANTAADTLRILGELGTGWTFLDKSFSGLPTLRNLRRRQVILLNASLYASDNELPRAALYFENASLETARSRGVANAIVEALIRRALLSSRLGNEQSAAEDIRKASELLPVVSSAASREYLEAWLAGVRGEVQSRSNPREALVAFDRAIHSFRRLEPAEVPRLCLLRGRAALHGNLAVEAERSFQLGISEVEERRQHLKEEQSRISYVDETWNLFDELIEFYASRDQTSVAFRYAERGRARTLSEATSQRDAVSADLADIRSFVPPSGVIVYYATVRDHLLTWVIKADELRFISQPVTASDLNQRVTIYRRLLESRRSPDETARVARDLYTTLIQHIEKDIAPAAQIVFIPDGILHAVPFATLMNPATNRYVIQDHAIGVLPSAKVFLAVSNRLRQMRSVNPMQLRALIIGSSRGDETLGLSYLPEVDAEIADVASLYRWSTSVTGPSATSAQFRVLAPHFNVLHFAGHATINASFPGLSQLLLASRGPSDSGVMYANEISHWRLPNMRLVALSACQTAFGSTFRGEGLVSLARQFLIAGVPSVIGSLWNVDDRTTRSLVKRFHEEFLSTGAPLASLQRAQLSLLDGSPSADARMTHSWAAFVAISGFDPDPTSFQGRRHAIDIQSSPGDVDSTLVRKRGINRSGVLIRGRSSE